ncbi:MULTISPECIES: hypothetical protein [unclassified Fusibacter]|uniref:hypothetical protein n=1 Tax=unclassified Fusibacter TaxID=2624464 RepID=UPI001010CF22|nr:MULTISPECIES: hypothetical protein [unclassified Fusibacter]MCK8060318.1 hypothetical protein [Fusibacter sp. A2]NPE20393.1 hypothetical protein [Fusibacter sp. A1]RXV63597.1 hypothetical protein DWB64_01075 [Fusibacter sp. A1]
MKIGIVGHEDNINRIQAVLREKFEAIEGHPINMHNMSQVNTTVNYIKEHLEDFDGLFFTGKFPYEIINHHMHSQLPSIYLENDESQLQRILLEASLKHHKNIKNITIDSYDIEAVNSIYAGFGFDKDDFTLYTSNINIYSNHLIKNLYDFHKKQHILSQTTAITGISTVYKMLQDDQVPSMLLTPNQASIENKIRTLLQKIKTQTMSINQIVVISVENDLGSDYDLDYENDYGIMLMKTKITEEIYKFAQSIQAAVVENEKSYILFTTRKILEFETNNLRELSILTSVKKRTNHTISVGIGFGMTAREAKSNAFLGKNKAIVMGGNQCFVVYHKNKMERVTPIDKQPVQAPLSDYNFKGISEAAGISVNNIYQLKSIMDIYKKDTFTSFELSKEFGNSLRSMNRIIEKLELAGFVEVVGKRVIGKAGRPSRVLKLLI